MRLTHCPKVRTRWMLCLCCEPNPQQQSQAPHAVCGTASFAAGLLAHVACVTTTRAAAAAVVACAQCGAALKVGGHHVKCAAVPKEPVSAGTSGSRRNRKAVSAARAFVPWLLCAAAAPSQLQLSLPLRLSAAPTPAACAQTH